MSSVVIGLLGFEWGDRVGNSGLNTLLDLIDSDRFSDDFASRIESELTRKALLNMSDMRSTITMAFCMGTLSSSPSSSLDELYISQSDNRRTARCNI